MLISRSAPVQTLAVIAEPTTRQNTSFHLDALQERRKNSNFTASFLSTMNGAPSVNELLLDATNGFQLLLTNDVTTARDVFAKSAHSPVHLIGNKPFTRHTADL